MCTVALRLAYAAWRKFDMETVMGVGIFVILGAILIVAAWTISH